MPTRPLQNQDEFPVVHPVDQPPTRLDVTFTETLIVSDECMVSVGGW